MLRSYQEIPWEELSSGVWKMMPGLKSVHSVWTAYWKIAQMRVQPVAETSTPCLGSGKTVRGDQRERPLRHYRKIVCPLYPQFMKTFNRSPHQHGFFFYIAATAPMTLITRTSSELAVRFTPTQPSARYELLARDPIAGRASVRCAGSECRLSGLRPFSNFTLWLVTCTGSNPKRCQLQAPPAETSTLPASKY